MSNSKRRALAESAEAGAMEGKFSERPEEGKSMESGEVTLRLQGSSALKGGSEAGVGPGGGGGGGGGLPPQHAMPSSRFNIPMLRGLGAGRRNGWGCSSGTLNTCSSGNLKSGEGPAQAQARRRKTSLGYVLTRWRGRRTRCRGGAWSSARRGPLPSVQLTPAARSARLCSKGSGGRYKGVAGVGMGS
jgi:hypothetical protein